MNRAAIAQWSNLEPLEPAYALVADVDGFSQTQKLAIFGEIRIIPSNIAGGYLGIVQVSKNT